MSVRTDIIYITFGTMYTFIPFVHADLLNVHFVECMWQFVCKQKYYNVAVCPISIGFEYIECVIACSQPNVKSTMSISLDDNNMSLS